MARGGFRPGAGRKKGTGKKEKTETKKTLPTHETEENRKLRELLSYDRKAKAKIYHEFVNRLGKGMPYLSQKRSSWTKSGLSYRRS